MLGCFGPPDLPAELEVVLPNDARQTATVNSGVVAFANSTWDVFRTDEADEPAGDDAPPGPYGGLINGGFLERVEPGGLVYTARFGEQGQAVEVTENVFYLPEVFGRRLIIDGEFHGTNVLGLEYAAAAFGVTRENQFGVAIPAEVRFFGITLGTAVVYSWGTLAGDEGQGIFGYQADLNPIPDLLLGSGGDQYRVELRRAE